MNRDLARSVVDAIACPCREHAIAVARFSEGDWRRSNHWLITSGLALHLLAALKDWQSEQCLPPRIATRLRELDRASRVRTEELRRDFLDLNRRFASLGAPYANWKGFALEPDFCADVRLRPQMDFDFIVLPSDRALFDSALRDAGYQRTRNTNIEASYEILPGQSYSLEEVYQPKPHRKVELHFAADHGTFVTEEMSLRGALERSCTVFMGGQEIPVLAPADAFLSHAAHAGRHALEGWVRLGWLHEIDHFVRNYFCETPLWSNVHDLVRCSDAPIATAAVGVLLAAGVWGRKLPNALGWAEAVLPRGAVDWVEAHGLRLAMADFPGTKLNLLLLRELSRDAEWREIERSALFRRRAIPMVVRAPIKATAGQRLRAARAQYSFTCRRTLFHLIETARYYVLKWRWGRAGAERPGALHPCNAEFKAHSNSLDG